MELRRFVTAERSDETVAVRRDTLVADTDAARGATLVWGWDRVPELPLDAPDGFDRSTLFPPAGGVNVSVVVLPPASGGPRGTEGIDLAHANVKTAPDDPLMHKTDSIDVIFVLDGEVTLEQPGDDADLELRRGDVVVQNGGFHRWMNHSERNVVLGLVLATTQRSVAA